MELERKCEIALQMYHLILREKGIRFFPKKAQKEASRIAKLVPRVDPFHVRCFMAEVYADVIFKELGIFQRKPEFLFSSLVAGEIALALLLDEGRESGVQLDVEDFKKKIGNAAKLTGVSKQELAEFYVEVICDFFKGIKV